MSSDQMKENQQKTKQVPKKQVNQKVKVEVKEEEDELLQNPNQKRKSSNLQDSKGSVTKKVIANPNAEINQWFLKQEEEDNEEDQAKWEYLEHNGVIVPGYYKKHNIKPLYQGKPIELTALQEEYATYWTQTLGTDWEQKPAYRNNFSRKFLKLFKEPKELADFDFKPIQKFLQETKEAKKNLSIEEKKENKLKKEKLDEKYGFAIVDGMKEKIAGYMIEAPTLFKGRGEHPKAGCMKARIFPEDIIINCASNAPIPKCDLQGHCWKDIVHDNKVTWLAYYKDDTINTTYKYIFLSQASKFRALNDKKKYEKARKLKSFIDEIRKDYYKKLNSSNIVDKQLGTATYLIDRLALRVGNEKDEDTADTVGCCSLRAEHITMNDNNQITLDFLGKDSMRYFHTVTVDEIVHKNLAQFLKGKKRGTGQIKFIKKFFLIGKEIGDELFDRINASSLNDYLRGLMEGLTAKVFRTYNASVTLQRELWKQDISKLDVDSKINYYDEANKQVAILCNHQRTVPKSYDLSKEKLEAKVIYNLEQILLKKIKIMKDYLEELKQHLKKFKKSHEVSASEKYVYIIPPTEEQGKSKKPTPENTEKSNLFYKKFPGKDDATKSLINKMEGKIEKEELIFARKEGNKNVALGTSKMNYNDPRITVSFCKSMSIPIEKVFTKTLREKFVWAMYSEPDWKF